MSVSRDPQSAGKFDKKRQCGGKSMKTELLDRKLPDFRLLRARNAQGPAPLLKRIKRLPLRFLIVFNGGVKAGNVVEQTS